jgi:hypothetical protein
MTNSNIPQMGALKVFSIIGIILSVLITVFGLMSVGELSATEWNDTTNTLDYHSVRGDALIGFLFLFNGAFFLTFSIIACVKAFKRYD